MNHSLSLITPLAVSGYAVFEANKCSVNVQQVVYRPGGGIMLLGTFFWAPLGPVVVVRQTLNAAMYMNIIAD